MCALRVGTVTARVTADSSSFNKSMERVRAKGELTAKKVKQSFANIGQTMRKVGRGMSIGLTLPLGLAAGAAIKAHADFEQLHVSLNTLLGSAKKGTQIFKELVKYAAKTPFETEGVTKATKTLLGFGIQVDDAVKDIKTLGDIAALSGSSIQDLAIPLGQAAAQGKALTRDLRQFINQGVPIRQMLAKVTGKTQNMITKMTEAGKITFPLIIKAMEAATSAGGKFANGAVKLSHTVSGVFSTMTDNIHIALAKVGKSISQILDIKGLMRSIAQTVENLTNTFTNLSDSAKRKILALVGILSAGGPLLVALGAVSAAISAISVPVLAVVGTVGTAVYLIVKNWDSVVSYFTSGQGAQMWDTISSVAKDLFSSLKNLFTTATQAIKKIWDKWGDTIIKIATVLAETVLKNLSRMLDALTVAIDVFAGDWTKAWKDIKKATGFAAQNIPKDFTAVNKAIDATKQKIADLKDKQASLGFGPVNLFKRLQLGTKIENATNKLGQLKDKLSEIKSGFSHMSPIDTSSVDSLVRKITSAPPAHIMLQPVAGADAGQKAKTETQKAVDSATAGGNAVKVPVVPIMKPDFGKPIKISPNIQFDVPDITKKLFPPGSIGAIQNKINDFHQAMMRATNPAQVQAYGNAINNLKGKINGLKGSMSEATASMVNNVFEQSLSNMITGISKMIGQVASGSKTLGQAGLGILKMLGKMAVRIGTMFITLGTSVAAALNPATLFASLGTSAIGAGIALVAAGAALQAIVGGITKMADGGIVSGPTYAMVGEYAGASSNPEVVSPLNKLKGMIADVINERSLDSSVNRSTVIMGGASHIELSGKFELEGDTALLQIERAKKKYR